LVLLLEAASDKMYLGEAFKSRGLGDHKLYAHPFSHLSQWVYLVFNMRLTQAALGIALFDVIARSLAQSSIPSSSPVIFLTPSPSSVVPSIPSSSANSTTLASSPPQSSPTTPGPPQTSQTTSQSVSSFVVPLSTQTLKSSLKLSTVFSPPSSTQAGSTAGGYVVVNPSNTKQSVAFAVATIPPDQQSGLPSATDLAPAALLLLGFALPVLLFGGGILVLPDVSASVAAGLASEGFPALSDYPGKAIAEGSNPTTATPSRSSASETTKEESSSSSTEKEKTSSTFTTKEKTSSSSTTKEEPTSTVTLHEIVTIQLALTAGPVIDSAASTDWITFTGAFPTSSSSESSRETSTTTKAPTTTPAPTQTTQTAHSVCDTHAVAPALPTLLSPSSGQTMNLQTLLYALREPVCNNTACDTFPAGIDPEYVQMISSNNGQECAMVAAIEGGSQALMVRLTAFTTAEEQQRCWDNTEYTITCPKEDNHMAWVNGPNPDEFVQGGFEKVNTELPGSLKLSTSFASSQYIPSATSTSPLPTPTGPVCAGICG
jgi:hypothetical protein